VALVNTISSLVTFIRKTDGRQITDGKSEEDVSKENRITDEIVKDTITAIELLAYDLVKKTPVVDDYRMQGASEVMSQWITEVSAEDIPSAQIFIDLQRRGWTIIPPP